jgi:hypothetical protein
VKEIKFADGGVGGGSRVQLVKKVGTIECRKEKY